MGNAGSSKFSCCNKRTKSDISNSSRRKRFVRHCHVIPKPDQRNCDSDESSPMYGKKATCLGDMSNISIKTNHRSELVFIPSDTDKLNDDHEILGAAEGHSAASKPAIIVRENLGEGSMADEETVEALQLQIQKLKRLLCEKDEVIRSLEKKLAQLGQEKELQVSGLKESVDMVIREKESEIRRLKAMWSPSEALPADVVSTSIISGISNATNLLNTPELGCDEHSARFGISAENRRSSAIDLFENVAGSEPKTKAQMEFVRKALQTNVFLKVLDFNQMNQLIDCMTQKRYPRGSKVITEGEYGSHLYVLEEGKVEVFHSKRSEQSEHVVDLKSGAIFGELAILYNCRRTASIRAQTEVVVWRLDRKDFQAIVKQSGQSKQNEYVRLLRTVEKLKSLSDNKLMRIADCLEETSFNKGDYIIRQGDTGDTFYIIQEGKVKVTHTKEIASRKKKKKYTEEHVCYLEKGQYFGESALLTEENRSANVIGESQNVTVLMLDRQAFNSLVGSIADIDRSSRQPTDVLDGIQPSSFHELSILSEEDNEYDDDEEEQDEVDGAAMSEPKKVTTRVSRSVATTIKTTPLNHLEGLFSKSYRLAVLAVNDECEKKGPILIPKKDCLLTWAMIIRILGQGGFGCVKLVTIPGLPRHAFALKSIRKAKIIKTGQHQHVLAERSILMDMRSPFIGKLHRTYKDDYKIYFLMDAYLGGDVYGVLKKVGSLTDPVARFYAACVLEALEYLHLRGIVYRDLKPENLMLDHNGYVKLVDFGFAKRLRFGYKTYTFCGTPEYFPPEIIANKGHDFAADFWSYGVLIYELLTRSTPFYARDDMTVYENILNGLEGVKFSKRISKNAEILIRGLCRLEPRNRLGNQRGGIVDIRKQRWFQGFDWLGLKDQRVPPPFDPDVRNPTDTKHFEKITEETFDKKEDKKLLKEANLIWTDMF